MSRVIQRVLHRSARGYPSPRANGFPDVSGEGLSLAACQWLSCRVERGPVPRYASGGSEQLKSRHS